MSQDCKESIPSIGSPTWPFVLAFAERMEAKLAENRHKGNRDDWVKDDIIDLRRRIHMELRELDDACNNKSSSEDIANEAADVANFCMMVADWYLHNQK